MYIYLSVLALVGVGFGHPLFAAEQRASERTELARGAAEQRASERTESAREIADTEKTAENVIITEAEPAFEAGDKGGEISETLKVTGSRIRRVDFEGPNPVTVWTKEDLDNSGYLSLSEFLTNTSLSNFGSAQIHNRSTLTLVNGARLVHDEALDYVPTSAIERIEILRDGSSALYGSDVVGGVINIITKKDMESPAISLKISPALYPFYKGGSEADASAVFGEQFNRGHFLSAWQFQYSGGLKMLDRKRWYADYFLEYSPYPSFQIEKDFIVDEKCPENLKVRAPKTLKATACKHDFVQYADIFPKSYNFFSYNYAELEMSGINFYTQWFGWFVNSIEPDGPIIADLKVPSRHKMSAGNGFSGTLKHLFKDMFSDEIDKALFLDALFGAKGYLSKTWDFDFSLKWSNIWKRGIYTKRPYLKDLQNAIVSGAYDPFNPKAEGLRKVRLHNAIYEDNDTRLWTSLDFSGETGLWDIDMALGLQAYVNKYRNNADPKVIKGEIFSLEPAETKDLPARTLMAGYAEGVKSFADLLEVQLAGRIDRYSDFGWTAIPKAAVSYKPFSGFLMRYSIGKSFEAPALSDLYTPETTGYIGVYDTVACYNELKGGEHFNPIYNSLTGKDFKSQEAKDKLIKEFLVEQSSVTGSLKLSKTVKASFQKLTEQLGQANYCRLTGVQGKHKGNKNLKETKAWTSSLGFHWDLDEDHSLTADYWLNSLSGSPIYSLHVNKKTIDAELLHGKAYVKKHGVQYERDNNHPFKPIKEGSPISSLINIGGKRLSGVDIKWSSDFSNWTFAGGNFYFKDEFAYVIKAGVEMFPGMGYINNLGKFGLPKWRNFATFGWRSPKHNISLYLKSAHGVKKTNNEFETLPSSHIVDLFYQYHKDSKTAFKLGWLNLLFSDPVLDDSRKQGSKFDRKFFDVRGPHFFVELRRTL